MKQTEWNEGLNHIDPALVQEYVEQKEKRTKNNKRLRLWTRIGALAACFALILGAVIIGPMLKGDGPVTPPDEPNDNSLPPVSVITANNNITGKQYLFYDGPANGANGIVGDAPGPGFGYNYNVVVEAEIIEVLPDTYCYGAPYNLPCHVAKLRIIDQVCGEGYPEEIYMYYEYYDTTVFEGYERFIISFAQVGIENFLLVNQTQGKVEYFPNMFQLLGLSDIKSGSVIAFNDGKVDVKFWQELQTTHPDWFDWINKQLDNPNSLYSSNSTIDQVKAKIKNIATSLKWGGRDYISAEDVFVSDEAKQVQVYLQPNENNTFVHSLNRSGDSIYVTYTRLVNGFVTNEEFTVFNNREIQKGDNWVRYEAFTTEDLTRVPDIGEAMANLNLSELQPPHTELNEDMELFFTRAHGFYRKANEKVYGIIRIHWHYCCPIEEGQKGYYESYYEGRGYVEDDCYYLYDSEGNGSIVEREELRAIIGNDAWVLLRFEYNTTQGYGIP